MPIYEFVCQQCGRLTNVFVKTMGSSFEAHCRQCDSTKLERSVSRFAYHRSELERYGSEPKRLEDYKDPRQIGQWAERKFQQYGIDVPQEAQEMIDAAREGELPKPIKDL